MKKVLFAATAGMMAMAGAALAQEEEMTPPLSADDCVLEAKAPDMPDPKKASAEDRAATIGEIKGFQSALNDYRTCLTTVSDNEELDLEVRQGALDAFNKTVETETKMVEDWQKFDKKYKKANK